MALGTFDDKTTPPEADQLAKTLGRAQGLWQALGAKLASDYAPLSESWKFGGKQWGWALQLKQRKRTVLYLTPCRSHFVAGFALGEKAVEAAHRSRLPASVLAEIDGARRYAEGRAVRIEVRKKADVLCLSMHAERRFVSAILEAGAAGYLLRDCAQEELAEAIRQVAAGSSYLSPAVAATVVEDYAAHLSGGTTADASPLSGREREVLQLLAEGLSTREIAERLYLSPKTVGSHRERIMRKLGIDSIAGLTKYAIRNGLTGPERDSSS